MRSALRTYSGVLQFRTETIHTLLGSPRGIAYALKLFLVVTLVAGLGRWFAVPALMAQPTLAEQIDRGVEAVRTLGSATSAAIWGVLVQNKPLALPDVIAADVQRQVTAWVDEASALTGGIIPATSAVDRLMVEDRVTSAAIEAAVAQSPATPAQLDLLLERASLPIEQARALLDQAGVTAAQVTAARAARTDAAAAADAAALAALAPVTEQLNMTDSELRDALSEISATPAQVAGALGTLQIQPAAVAQVFKDVELKAADVKRFVDAVRAEAVKLEPPMGARPARIVKLAGAWLATPFQVAANYIFFALMLLLVAKSLGGRATLPQHLAAVALAAAPGVLWLGAFIPDMSPVLPVTMSLAMRTFANLLALIGLHWGAALLLRTVALAHRFGMWKTLGVVLLTWVTMYVVLPLGLLWASAFLFS